MSSEGHCACGQTEFGIHGVPLLRGYCHCQICQAYNQSAYADITLFRTRDVDMPPEGQVVYKSWQAPGLVQRGTCSACGKPALEHLRLPFMPAIVIVPTANIVDDALIPEPSLHIFYNRRVADIDDGLPKHSGYLPSQLAFAGRLISALMKTHG